MSTAPSRSPLFDARDPTSVTKALHGLDAGLLIRVGDSLRGALNGSDNAARLYVRDYRRLTGCLLAEAKRVRPDLIEAWSRVQTSGRPPQANEQHAEDLPTVADMLGRSTSVFAAVIENGSASAPFSPWTSRFELSDAIGLDLTNQVRELLGAHRLTVPAGGEDNKHHALVVDEVNAQRFLRRVRYHLNHPDDEEPLGRLADAFGLSKTELAGLFGVRRQAIDGWLANGVPAERQEKLVTLLDIVELLDRKLKAGRLPGVARRPADVYDGHTMLELISADRHRELLESIRASFDWSTAA
jgi:hypothetical protein